MARMRVLLVLLVAIAAGGGLAYGTYKYVQNMPASAAPLPTRPVVVAAARPPGGAAPRPPDGPSGAGPGHSPPARRVGQPHPGGGPRPPPPRLPNQHPL